jgi:hypothetical protein
LKKLIEFGTRTETMDKSNKCYEHDEKDCKDFSHSISLSLIDIFVRRIEGVTSPSSDKEDTICGGHIWVTRGGGRYSTTHRTGG